MPRSSVCAPAGIAEKSCSRCRTRNAPWRQSFFLHGGENETLVAARDRDEQCARSQAWRFHLEESQADCGFAQALRRTQPPAQDDALPLGAVDAHLLHEPRRQESAGGADADSRTREGRTEKAVP